jgi:hypothetical protein
VTELIKFDTCAFVSPSTDAWLKTEAYSASGATSSHRVSTVNMCMANLEPEMPMLTGEAI